MHFAYGNRVVFIFGQFSYKFHIIVAFNNFKVGFNFVYEKSRIFRFGTQQS